jgi:hypothetical protein
LTTEPKRSQPDTPPRASGTQLCERFYWACVRPILEAGYPGLPHAAALLDSGSEVLGFDDALSTDHDWGPRVLLFLNPSDHATHAAALHVRLAQLLPDEFEGYSTSFTAADPETTGVQGTARPAQRRVNHHVPCYTFHGFVAEYLNFDLDQPIEPADWLTFSEQRLLTLTTGPVFHDGIGLNEARTRFGYYPRDVWLYLLAAGWARIGDDEHLMGRAGHVGDELGSAIIGARLVRDALRLCFLMERTYAPYPKWLGSAFGRLAVAPALSPALTGALQATNWHQRESHLVQAYRVLAGRHNALGLTEPLPEEPADFFGRPFQVIGLNGFVEALLRQIQDPRVRAIAQLPLIGSLDLFSDNTALHSSPLWRPRLRRLYRDEDKPSPERPEAQAAH